jgi:hypothetical protein
MRNIEPDFNSLNQKFDELLNQSLLESESTQKLIHIPLADAGISIGRFADAQALLLQAHANDPNNNDIKFKLGKNYLVLYQNEVQSLHGYSLPAQRKTQRQRLQKKYFDPALKLLNDDDHSNIKDQLIPSLLHYFEGEFELALEKLELSESQLLWPIERLLLAAQINYELANQKLLIDQKDHAIEYLNNSFTLLAQAKTIARSHPEVHKQLCLTQSQLLQLTQHQTSINISSCDEYLIILPQTADAILVAADAYAQLAKAWLDQGQSPTSLLFKSRSILDHDWQSEADNQFAQAEQIRGHLLSTEGKWQLYSNQEFTKYFTQAIEHHKNAVIKQPNNYSSQLDLAAAWHNLANNARYSAEFTDHHFNQATEILTALLAHADATQFLAGYLVKVLSDHAYIRYQNGEPADQQLQQADSMIQQFISKSPEGHYAVLAQATLYWTYSDYLVLQGKNPQPYLQHAIDAFDHAIVFEPSNWTTRYNQISAMLSGIIHQLDQQTVQTIQLETVKEKLLLLEELISTAINLDSHWGYYHNMMALNDLLLNKNPLNDLTTAWQQNAACSNSPIDGYICNSQMATSLVIETRWNIENPEQQIMLHKNYIETIQTAVHNFPKHHRLNALFGQYLWLKSKSPSVSPEQKSKYLDQAKSHLEAAISGNQLLIEKYSGDLNAIDASILSFRNSAN